MVQCGKFVLAFNLGVLLNVIIYDKHNQADFRLSSSVYWEQFVMG